MNLQYLLFRVFRRLIPLSVSNVLLRRNIGIKVSMGTSDPEGVVIEYLQELSRVSRPVRDAVIMEIGYGGSFGAAIGLLSHGVRHVYLHDAYVKPNHRVNRALFDSGCAYLMERDGMICPDPRFITLLPKDPARWSFLCSPVEIILSRAVLEHVADVGALFDLLIGNRALSGATHAHFIDMRDHYLRFPYEMFCYDEWVWHRFLCPTEHLNRMRMHDYRLLFENRFRHCEIRITDKDEQAFSREKHRIKRCFLSGDDAVDAAQRAWVLAW